MHAFFNVFCFGKKFNIFLTICASYLVFFVSRLVNNNDCCMFCWNKNFKLQPELLVLQREHLFLLPELPFTQTMISDFKIACNIYFVPWSLSIQLVSCWLLVWLLQQCWTLNTFGGMTTIILLFLAFTIFFLFCIVIMVVF